MGQSFSGHCNASFRDGKGGLGAAGYTLRREGDEELDDSGLPCSTTYLERSMTTLRSSLRCGRGESCWVVLSEVGRSLRRLFELLRSIKPARVDLRTVLSHKRFEVARSHGWTISCSHSLPDDDT